MTITPAPEQGQLVQVRSRPWAVNVVMHPWSQSCPMEICEFMWKAGKM